MSVFALAVILQMPIRDARLETGDISKPFTQPTSSLRSPEDDLNFWQWMTVMWMRPLMALGSSRKLNDEDVWLLPYEFQHTRLHLLFRELQGSVLRRLIRANGLDLIITSFLGILESFASMRLSKSPAMFF